MAQITVYMNYVIFFQDEAEYNNAIAIAGGNLLELAPRAAATMFGIPHPYPSGNIEDIPKGIYFIFPFTVGTSLNFPLASGLFVDDTVNSQLVPGQAGNPASIFPAGPDGLNVWSASIVFSPGAGISSDPPSTAIAQRRFCIGFEWSELQLEGSVSSTSSFTSRDASRTIDGKGFAIRGDQYNFFNVPINVLRTGLTSATSWERFYIRTRRLPSSGSIRFWQTKGTTAPLAGAGLRFNSAGEIRLTNINFLGTEFDKGVVFTPVTNKWNRIDVLIKYSPDGIVDARCFVYVNGVFAFSFIDASGEGMRGSAGHSSTDFGMVSGANNEVEIDLDDWISADLPANIDASTLTFAADTEGIDWLLGSHVRKHWVESASLVNWAPNAFGHTNQGDNPEYAPFAVAELTSSTSSAQIDGLTDALPQNISDSIANVLGAVAACIGDTSKNAGSTDGSLGYRKAGDSAVLAVIDENTSFVQYVKGYLPSGMILPDEISPWSVVYQKSADANLATVRAVSSVVEYLGVWGPEDDPLFDYPISRLTFLHNCNYANTQWGYVGSAPDMPVAAVGGIYTGNGTTQEIVLPGPCHFLWIRNTNGGGNGTVLWLGPMIGMALTNSRVVIPDLRVFSDITGVFKFRITGNAAHLNQNTHTYQYIAFCDPGMRYNLTGVYNHDSGSSTPKVNALINSLFTAEAGFVTPQLIGITGGENPVYKGPGIGANSAVPLNAGVVLANYMNFASGVLNTFADAHFGMANAVYSLWRTSDSGSGGCSNVMIQIQQYTGDGVNPRNITLTPTSGRHPLFVMVIPNAAANGYWRDPSHTTNQSSFVQNNGLSTDAITAVGIDQITVNFSLNSGGVVYSVFVICGDVAGMNNGTFNPTYCDPSAGGPWMDPNPPLGDINVIGDGGLILNGLVPLLILKDISGIYTLVPDKLNDTLMDRQTGQTSVDVPILPVAKTGYVGG